MELDLLERSALLDKVEKELFENRVIYLNEDISNYTISNIVPLIHRINILDEDVPQDKKVPIRLYITSAGGSAYDGWEIVQAIKSSKTPIHGYVLGYAMSMGLPIYLACHKRFLGKYATLLYHELRGGATGTRQEVKRLDKEYDRLQKLYDDFIIEHTKLTQEILNDHQERVSDWYIGLEDATKYEMYDELV